MKLIVGLGNPEKKYNNTRHNIGFDVVLKFWETRRKKEGDFSPWKFEKKFQADISKSAPGKNKTILALPQTFMNNSGLAVKELSFFYKIKPENILVIHDDIDINLGEFKIQKNRGSAGHNGVKSIINELGSKNFNRIRIGIRNKEVQGKMPTEKFVLEKFTLSESATLEKIIEKDIIPALLQ